jgi:hypothetical protein
MFRSLCLYIDVDAVSADVADKSAHSIRAPSVNSQLPITPITLPTYPHGTSLDLVLSDGDSEA